MTEAHGNDKTRFSAKTTILTVVIAIILAFITFFIIMPSGFNQEDIDYYEAMTTKIARQGLYTDGIEQESDNLLAQFNNRISDISIKSSEYDAYTICFRTYKGKISYRVDAYTIKGPSIDRMSFEFVSFVVALVVFGVFCWYGRYLVRKIEMMIKSKKEKQNINNIRDLNSARADIQTYDAEEDFEDEPDDVEEDHNMDEYEESGTENGEDSEDTSSEQDDNKEDNEENKNDNSSNSIIDDGWDCK